MKIYKKAKELPESAKVFIYGAGIAGRAFYFYLKKLRPDIEIKGFIDTYKKGKCCGLKIYKLKDFLKRFNTDDYDLILIASMYYEVIGNSLSKNGIKNYALVKGKNPAYSVFVEERSVKTYFKRFYSLLIRLISYIIPKNRKKFVVVGEYEGNFVGNSKYFYLYLKNRGDVEAYWLTKRRDNYNYLLKQGVNIILYGKLKTFFLLLTSRYIIFDNRDWYREYEVLNLLKAEKIQLWHGVGFKYIELSLLSEEFLKKLSVKEWKILNKRYPQYNLLITTSEFYSEKVFAPAFNLPLERVKPLGYPRNDVLYKNIDEEEINTDKKIIELSVSHKKNKGKIIVFAPTFRDLNLNVDMKNVFDYERLNEFLIKNNILFIIKGHSLPNIRYFIERIDDLKNILIYENKKDVYPLLRITDLLITDYSSIYTDFLHTNKPVLFYPYDFKEYNELHRQLQFDYNKMTPGPKAKNFNKLLDWIKYFLIDNKDEFERERKDILELAFKYKDGNSSQRIFNYII